jgi:hypothetical protein
MSALQILRETAESHSRSKAEPAASAASKLGKRARSFISPILTTGICLAAMLLLIVPLLTLEADARGGGGGGGRGAAEVLADTVVALAGKGDLRDAVGEWALPPAAQVWALVALAPSVWRVSAGRASELAPSAWRVSAERVLELAPSAWRVSAGQALELAPLAWLGWGAPVSEPAHSRPAVSPGVR